MSRSHQEILADANALGGILGTLAGPDAQRIRRLQRDLKTVLDEHDDTKLCLKDANECIMEMRRIAKTCGHSSPFADDVMHLMANEILTLRQQVAEHKPATEGAVL